MFSQATVFAVITLTIWHVTRIVLLVARNVMLGDKFVYMLHETVILLFSSNISSLTQGSTENNSLRKHPFLLALCRWDVSCGGTSATQ